MYYYGENLFEHLHDFLAPSQLNTYVENEHIRDIKRSIQTIKDRVICGCHSITYKKVSKLMSYIWYNT